MPSLPLLSHSSPDCIVAYRRSGPVTVRRFVADAMTLAAYMPAGGHVLNVCTDRYRFTVGLAACLISQRVSLLPSTHTPEMIAQMAAFAPDAFCLTDDPRCGIELPRCHYPDGLSPQACDHAVPLIPAGQLAAIVFTSGSTGMPLPHHKTWGLVSACVRNGAPLLGLTDGRLHTLIGTVPPQHMYGFESTVLLALLSGNAFSAAHPFYPADVAAAVAAVPQPRVLVTTPVHLRALLQTEGEFPGVDLVISATAPLARTVACAVEERFGTRLMEIYGSTETGQIAMRRSATTDRWRLWDGVRLTVRGAPDGELTVASGGHVEQPTALADVVEIVGEHEFLLHGRTADLVNIAGKRSSFGYLNAQLNAIAGVVDGAFFLGDNPSSGTGVTRLGALVVAPGMSAALLTEQLKQRIDPVFLPRPLLLVDKLPRNATGKLPQHALQQLAGERLRGDAGRA
jgi:acyl-coenzyme A synthetase/AMP-(fatty) acid ligase